MPIGNVPTAAILGQQLAADALWLSQTIQQIAAKAAAYQQLAGTTELLAAIGVTDPTDQANVLAFIGALTATVSFASGTYNGQSENIQPILVAFKGLQ